MSGTYEAPIFQHWIAGNPTPASSQRTFEDRNPLDDTVYAMAALGNDSDVAAAVENANDAFQKHGRLPPGSRESWLLNAADLLERNAVEFANILIDEIGSPIVKAEKEIATSVRFLRTSAGAVRQVSGKTLPTDVPGRMSFSIRQPLGVVAAFTPFNVPLIKFVKQTAMAIATGNAVVLLPSEEAPAIAVRMAQLYTEAGIPNGLVNVLTGRGAEIGDALTTHPLVRAVSFTGSTRIGRHIGELCGRLGKRFALEMGGKNPLVVLKDADVDAAVQASVLSSFLYQGQICMASSRIYVERPRLDEFLKKFVKVAQSLGMGDLRDRSTVIGPIINDRQRAGIRTHLDDAFSKGATILSGGDWIANRCQPTVLTDVTTGMMLHREETFGPVVAVYAVESAEDALMLANDSSYGLSASVFTSNLSAAVQFAHELNAGMVHVNGATIQEEPHVPFGGFGDSGFGREGTEAAIDELTEWKWITVQ